MDAIEAVIWVACNLAVVVVAVNRDHDPNNYDLGNGLASLVDIQMTKMMNHVVVYMDPGIRWLATTAAVVVVFDANDSHYHSKNCLEVEGNSAVDHYKFEFPNKLDDQWVSHCRIDPYHSLKENDSQILDREHHNDYNHCHDLVMVVHNADNQMVAGDIYPLKETNKHP